MQLAHFKSVKKLLRSDKAMENLNFWKNMTSSRKNKIRRSEQGCIILMMLLSRGIAKPDVYVCPLATLKMLGQVKIYNADLRFQILIKHMF